MAKEICERTRQMLDQFMSLHNEGLTIPQIAEHFGISADTVYRNLQDIADANGVSRESLLEQPKTPSLTTRLKKERKCFDTDFDSIIQNICEAEEALQESVREIDNILGGMQNG